ncbi:MULTISPECIES: hypothetical protein [Streptomyces]|uniref:DNA primase n=1 Tax=Streptomyces californicus TaxID=67351 RepID=A0ABD7D413_9ACTN|nr:MULTISPECIES: hypothetical protein [Streptomyces]NEA12304.1 hypothetical protein [Streptomyces sp. SID10692]NEC45981.1 hypothetical protein [Streptomyces sp. SID8016]KOU47283.1 hypothetical protein ADK56_25655 [Streptomyces sp. MMG1522]MBD3551377.1 hypothetical protein [Streptomyces sp. SP18CM02]MCC0576189.1 hypothetical protein [Streptomyces californicus]
MTKNAKIGAALVGGYLLGRTKKAKLALGFGMFLLGKKMDLDPRQIGRMLADSPVLGSLNDQVRKELVDATKTAATKALTQRAGSLADSLQQRTQALGSAPAADDEEPEEDDEPKKAARSSDRDEEADGDEKPKRAPRKTASSAAKSATASRSRSSSGSGRSSGGKSAAPARKRGSGSGTARKSTSSGARKARGGDDA